MSDGNPALERVTPRPDTTRVGKHGTTQVWDEIYGWLDAAPPAAPRPCAEGTQPRPVPLIREDAATGA